MKKKIDFFFIFTQISYVLLGQSANISGYVSDIETGEKLFGAIIRNYTGKSIVTTNEYGYFSIDYNSATVLYFSYTGYKKIELRLNSAKDTIVNVFLEQNNEIEEVVVSSEKNIISQTDINTINVDLKQIRKLPSLGGETDLIKAIKILPGIQSGNEGTTGLYVRGGGADQNLFLLDGVPLYNISHLFGFMSIFNDNAVNSMTIIKGGFPAHYGGRLSSVIDIRMKEGSLKKICGLANIGLISSEFMIEGPIKKDKSSFLISARRTYIDGITGLLNIASDSDLKSNYWFYDITGKVNYKFSDRSRLYFSSYLGDDKYKNEYYYETATYYSKDISEVNWGNRLINLRHNYIFNKKVFLNTSLYYSYYKLNNLYNSEFQNIENNINNYYFGSQYSSDINDIGLISDLDIYKSENYHIKTGLNITRHTFLPGIKNTKTVNAGETNQYASDGKYIHANEYRFYIENDINLSSKIKFNLGINTSLFQLNDTFYYSAEPRFSGIFSISDNNSLKASYSKTQQYLHLLTNSSFGLPTDLWVPATEKISPQKAEQFAVGFYQKIAQGFTLSIELYYKKMKNLITYKDNSSFFIEGADWDTKVLTNGKGKSYGTEILLTKSMKKINIMAAYTLSKTTRQFDELNKGKEYSYKYDRRHDIALSVIYKINDNIDFSANWIYGTGNAVTLPIAIYPSTLYPPDNVISFNSDDFSSNLPFLSIQYRNNSEIFDYGERNSQRLPAYHRLDLNFSFKKQKIHGNRVFTVGLYNAYNRRNPYYLTYAFDNDGFGNYDASGEFRIVSLFPVLPSLSYSYEF